MRRHHSERSLCLHKRQPHCPHLNLDFEKKRAVRQIVSVISVIWLCPLVLNVPRWQHDSEECVCDKERRSFVPDITIIRRTIFRMQTVRTHVLCYIDHIWIVRAHQPAQPTSHRETIKINRVGDGGPSIRDTFHGFCIKRPLRSWMANSQSTQAQVKTLKHKRIK